MTIGVLIINWYMICKENDRSKHNEIIIKYQKQKLLDWLFGIIS